MTIEKENFMYLKNETDYDAYDAIIVGCGFSGAVVARELADAGKRILIVEKKNEISGMMADYTDKNGICIHKYGPHVFMMNSEEILNYLKRFCELIPVTNYVHAFIDSRYVSIPANFYSFDALYGEEKSKRLQRKMTDLYGEGKEVHILTMRNSDDEEIRELADELYNKIFVGYNAKMWGLKPEELDPSIPGRLPIRVAYNNKNCKKKYELIPSEGYINLFNRIVDSHNIDILLNRKAADILSVREDRIYVEDKPYKGIVVYTAPLDELFSYAFGKLPYRALYFETDVFKGKREAPSAVTTFPMNYDKVRTTDMVELLDQKIDGFVANVSEYPGAYDMESDKFNVPAYPVLNDGSHSIITKYKEKADAIKNFYYVGRLAEFKYYDMEASIESALRCSERILGGEA